MEGDPGHLFSSRNWIGLVRREERSSGSGYSPPAKDAAERRRKNWRPGRKAKGCAAKEREVWDGTGVGTPQPHGEDGVRG